MKHPYESKVLKAAYKYCEAINKAHYENFPVASIIVPKKQRQAIHAIYAFSRFADDFADEALYEGNRQEKLSEWGHYLLENNPTHPIFIALKDATNKHKLPVKLFQDLLTAFVMDTKVQHHKTFEDILFYCKHSANPVGRLILHLFKEDSQNNLKASDAICTALQLTNFWQDISIDLKKERVYLPEEDLMNYNYNYEDLKNHVFDSRFINLLKFQVKRAHSLFLEGIPLCLNLSGRLGIEIRLTWLTGHLILDKIIKESQYDIFTKRPELKKTDLLKLAFISIRKNKFLDKVNKIKNEYSIL